MGNNDSYSSPEDSTEEFISPVPIEGSATDPLISKKIGSCTIKRIIGSGGMGTVYEAVQDSPRRRVALKMMKRGEYSRKIGPFMSNVRKVNPRSILRTDLIIGWPTETEQERLVSLDFAGQYFDEIALYSIELSPTRPAWQFKDDAFSEEELDKIRRSSVAYINSRYPDVVVHSGQQDDNTMKVAEEKRMKLRESREALV